MAHVFDADLGTAENDAAGTSLAITTIAAAASGSEIFVAVADNFSASTTHSVADSAGNTYERIPGPNPFNDNTISIRLSIWRAYAPSGLGSGATITATHSLSTTRRRMVAFSLTGGSSGTLAQVSLGQAWTVVTSATVNSPDLVVPLADSTILRFIATGGSATMTWSAGTELHDYVTPFNYGLKTAYSLGQSAGTYDAAGTLSGSNDQVSAVVALSPTTATAPYVVTEGAVAVVTTGTLTVTLPAHATNDILCCSVVIWAPVTAGTLADIPDLATWTKVGHVKSPATPDGAICLFWKRAASGAETNPVFTRGASWDTGTDTAYAGRGYAIRGCITTGDPYDELDPTAAHTAANQACDALTVSAADRLCAQFYASTDDYTLPTRPRIGNWAERESLNTATGTDAGFGVFFQRGRSTDSAADTSTVAAPVAGFYTFIGASFKPAAAAGSLVLPNRHRRLVRR